MVKKAKVQKRKNNLDLVVSVESCKGGVGKTTAALCLARILLKRGYKVLFLDLDLTGTNAADIANSPFWNENVHVAKELKDNSKHKLNLFTLFDRQFMAGKAMPEFSFSETESRRLALDSKKVNILGSQLFQTDSGNDVMCLEHPEKLFDELRTLWLLEFIKQIAENFIQAARTDSQSKTVIILDNSPGYAGIAPAVHEWLTDQGPEFNKFLFVASLDKQDLLACNNTIDSLHKLYEGKWDTSRQFSEAGKTGPELNISKDQEAFFMRLASVSGRETVHDSLAFYKIEDKRLTQEQKEKRLEELKEKCQQFCDHPENYIAAILNRVPRAVKTGRLKYDFESIFHERTNNIFERLHGNGEQEWRNTMISYDEYIENQFLLSSLQLNRKPYKHQIHRLRNVLKTSEKKLLETYIRKGDESSDSPGLHRISFALLRKSFVGANTVLQNALDEIDGCGLNHIARLIHNKWLPGSIVADFRFAFTRLIRESESPNFEILPFEISDEWDYDRINQYSEEYSINLKQRIKENSTPVSDQVGNQIETILTELLSWLAGSSFKYTWEPPFEIEMSNLLTAVLSIEFTHWAKNKETGPGKLRIQRFLAEESITKEEIHSGFYMRKPFFRFYHRSIEQKPHIFREFYEACTSAQARLIDIIPDSRFLLRLLRYVVEDEMGKGNLFPFIKGIAEDVIVMKTLSHEDAPRELEKALRTSQYFGEFDDVLEGVLKDWGIER